MTLEAQSSCIEFIITRQSLGKLLLRHFTRSKKALIEETLKHCWTCQLYIALGLNILIIGPSTPPQ